MYTARVASGARALHFRWADGLGCMPGCLAAVPQPLRSWSSTLFTFLRFGLLLRSGSVITALIVPVVVRLSALHQWCCFVLPLLPRCICCFLFSFNPSNRQLLSALHVLPVRYDTTCLWCVFGALVDARLSSPHHDFYLLLLFARCAF